jgi:MFS family permease
MAVRVLLGHFGVQRMCLIASVMAFLAYLALGVWSAWWQAALAMLVAGLAFFMVHNTLQTVATELAPGARGSAVALFASALFLGQGIGPLVLGPVVHWHGATVGIYGIAVCIGLLGQFVARRVAGNMTGYRTA